MIGRGRVSGSGNHYNVLLSYEKPNKNKPSVSVNTDKLEALRPLFTKHFIHHGCYPGSKDVYASTAMPYTYIWIYRVI
jgi:hypothetical protein